MANYAESGGASAADVLGNLARRLAYVLRAEEDAHDLGGAPSHVTQAVPAARQMVRVTGVGRATKDPRHILEQAARDEHGWRLPTEDLLTGLHAAAVPIVYRLRSFAGGVSVELGVWSARPDTSPALLGQRLDVLTSVLQGLYATVDTEPADACTATGAPAGAVSGAVLQHGARARGGVCLGVPEVKVPRGAEFLAPVERVVRALRDGSSAVTVLAQPLPASHSAHTRNLLLAEMRAVQIALAAERVAAPLAEQYLEILKQGLAMLVEGAATGLWRTGVYLTGDERSYPALAATWRSVYASSTTLFEPLAVLDWAGAEAMAHYWALPDVQGATSPSFYQRPYQHQSLLTSRQLAAYVHLPEQELPGFAVTLLPAFDTVRRDPTDESETATKAGRPSSQVLTLGPILHRTDKTTTDYTITVDDLSRHVLTCGATGSGKTTTVMGLIRKAVRAGVPYLVVEPVKTEYRALANDTVEPAHVYTAGTTVSPLRLNPFEVPDGTALSVHVDLLRALFAASFSLWSPMPQILERCLHAVYADRGWSLLDGTNPRLDRPDDPLVRAEAWPTLTDLAEKVDEVIGQLGYTGEVVSNLRTGLSTRIEGLRVGGKGAMLDVSTGSTAADLFERPVVLELEALGADEDRAFVMGLIVMRLVERRRADGPSATRHLLVLEEAHRLLSRSQGPAAAGQDDAKGKAVEAFVDMLAEIRAYGQAIIIADQVPVRLAPEVLKNTNLKIMHRTVADEDRRELAAASAMTLDQAVVLATLERGQAAVFSEGDDGPLLVDIDPSMARPRRPRDTEVRAAAEPDPEAVAATADHSDGTAAAPVPVAALNLARTPAWRAATNRLALSVASGVTVTDDAGSDLRDIAARTATGDPDHDALLVRAALAEAARWLTNRRAAQDQWAYSDAVAWRRAFLRVADRLVLRRNEQAQDDAHNDITDFVTLTTRLHARNQDPYPHCGIICDPHPPTCLYRRAGQDLLHDTTNAYNREEAQQILTWTDTRRAHDVALNCGAQLVSHEPGSIAAPPVQRAALCLLQEATHNRPGSTPTENRIRMGHIMATFGLKANVQA